MRGVVAVEEGPGGYLLYIGFSNILFVEMLLPPMGIILGKTLRCMFPVKLFCSSIANSLHSFNFVWAPPVGTRASLWKRNMSTQGTVMSTASHAQEDSQIYRGPDGALSTTVRTHLVLRQIANGLELFQEAGLILDHEVLGVVGPQFAAPKFICCSHASSSVNL